MSATIAGPPRMVGKGDSSLKPLTMSCSENSVLTGCGRSENDLPSGAGSGKSKPPDYALFCNNNERLRLVRIVSGIFAPFMIQSYLCNTELPSTLGFKRSEASIQSFGITLNVELKSGNSLTTKGD